MLKAVRLIDPSFDPQISNENIYYTCPLLNHLNLQKVRHKLKFNID